VLALSPEEISESLQLDEIEDRKWSIVACSAKTNEGLQEGVEWVLEEVSKNKIKEEIDEK